VGLQGIKELMMLDPQPAGHQERQCVEAEWPSLLDQGVQDGAGGGGLAQVERVELDRQQRHGDGEHAVAEGLQPHGGHSAPWPRRA
jgi:hypothetical protein